MDDDDVPSKAGFLEQKMGEEHARPAAVYSNSIFRRAKERAFDYRRSIPIAPLYLCYDAFLFAIRGSLEHRDLTGGPNFVMGDAIGRYENRVLGIVRDKIEIHLWARSSNERVVIVRASVQVSPSDCIEIIRCH